MVSLADPALIEEFFKNSKIFALAENFEASFGTVFPWAMGSLQGEPWKKVRRLVQDGIQRQRLGKLLMEAQRTTALLVKKLASGDLRKPVDLVPELVYVLYDAFGVFGWGLNFDTINGKNLDALDHGMACVYTLDRPRLSEPVTSVAFGRALESGNNSHLPG